MGKSQSPPPSPLLVICVFARIRWFWVGESGEGAVHALLAPCGVCSAVARAHDGLRQREQRERPRQPRALRQPLPGAPANSKRRPKLKRTAPRGAAAAREGESARERDREWASVGRCARVQTPHGPSSPLAFASLPPPPPPPPRHLTREEEAYPKCSMQTPPHPFLASLSLSLSSLRSASISWARSPTTSSGSSCTLAPLSPTSTTKS